MGNSGKSVLICGSTGSIGMQALDVIAGSEQLTATGLTAHSNWRELLARAREHRVARVALADPEAAGEARAAADGIEVLAGQDGVAKLIAESGSDIVLNAIVGSAGLGPTVVALSEGIDLALANKESLVVAGDLVMALAEATGSKILPVDSEHSAIFQLMRNQAAGSVDRIVLTASGGPFRGAGAETLSDVTVEQALAHPTWQMGGKITIDSATLMNKGLEVIEAHHLFGFSYDKIEVVVHPQSIVHSLIGLNDGATLAHLGNPDMRVPISFALHFPQREDVAVEPLDLVSIGRLEFERPDLGAFRCLGLAREAGIAGGAVPCILNAANEVAVHSFLEGKLRFSAIPDVIEASIDSLGSLPALEFDDLYLADAQARAVAAAAIEGLVQA